jgi:hypothetical protein
MPALDADRRELRVRFPQTWGGSDVSRSDKLFNLFFFLAVWAIIVAYGFVFLR